ncbi:serine/threonine-protein kinase [Microbacterium sp. No. 7]|uniref:serine/threonine-protein kinase n=1 Tax=Microbacterium sp. No. 7 TaxID=1714373 RepID=UPI0006CF4A40|nr:serine/threonine-protein kinase [Microbacterium sp. No. 7]ALJ19745.1 serine/threonine protein kinase [Microbacterium sp. No. 7]
MASRLPSAPPVLPGFAYVRPLGTGGFADVFLFEQHLPRRSVAVKVLLDEIVDDGVRSMFNAEADVMARLGAHPSILTIYEASVSSDGRPYLVMEYCPTSLTTRYRRERIPVDDVLQLGVKIGSALESAHQAGVLHRDIKPSNVLISAFGAPVLSDFGIAAALDGRTGGGRVFAMSLPWSAPEVVDEQVSGSIASEVWSLGATLYSLLAGHSPFELPSRDRNTRDQLRERIRRARYQPIPRDDVPDGLQWALARTMSRRPEDRHASVAELVHELQQIQLECGLHPTPHEIAHGVPRLVDAGPDAHDPGPRGPVRSTVAHPSRRPARTGARRAGPLAPADDGRERRSSRAVATAVVAGTLAVVIIGTLAALSLSGAWS